jgi:predicted pyridoxine 5'-phosphate oxidase superfamily flavin-nucleotide-binding protein
MPIALTDEMMTAINNSFADRSPCLVGTASKDGVPDISFRGSTIAYDQEHLAFWERAKGETLRNIEENPHVVVFYRNAQTRQSWRFYGTVQVIRDGAMREEIMGRVPEFELAQDADRSGFAVLIRIDRVRDRSATIMQR